MDRFVAVLAYNDHHGLISLCRFVVLFILDIQHVNHDKKICNRVMGNKSQTPRGPVDRDVLTPARVAAALRNGGIELADKHFAALNHYLAGATKSVACELAGLNATASFSVFTSNKMQAAMAVVLERFLLTDAAPAALRCLYSIVQDERAAPGVRVTAANSLLDRAGFDTKRLAKQGSGERDAQTMTADELRAEIARLEREREARMRDVSPDSAPTDSYVIDFP